MMLRIRKNKLVVRGIIGFIFLVAMIVLVSYFKWLFNNISLYKFVDLLLITNANFLIGVFNPFDSIFLRYKKYIRGLKEMYLSSMGGILELKFLASCGYTHWHILIPIKLIYAISKYGNYYFIPWWTKLG